MIRTTKVIRAGHWSGVATDTVLLAYDDRHRRRVTMTGEGGLDFLLDLPEAVHLADGDGLVLEDGRMVAVRARPEPLLAIDIANATEMTRIAWHLGNRHTPAQIAAGRILIRPDHVLRNMLAGLGVTVSEVEAPFDPEGGAYGGHGHGHDHSHGHGHDH